MSACKFAAPPQRDDQDAAARHGWPRPRQSNARDRQRFKRVATGEASRHVGLRGPPADLYGPAFFFGDAALAAHSCQMVVAANHDGWEPGDAQGSLN
jgi:hypothetical protein